MTHYAFPSPYIPYALTHFIFLQCVEFLTDAVSYDYFLQENAQKSIFKNFFTSKTNFFSNDELEFCSHG